MQLYALDENLVPTSAKNSFKNKNYTCLECQSPLRLRGGIHRQNHFYHLEPNRSCRQSGKSLEHLQVQLFLQKILPKGDCLLEKRFKQIDRIADVVWISKNLIFEVQCSPISKEEVEARNRDYEKMGYSVVWILHDKRYNQKRASSIEIYLQTFPHYFTNIDERGRGIIYDCFRLFQKGREVFKTENFSVNLSEIGELKTKKRKIKEQIPPSFLKKIEKASFNFKGDLIDYCYSECYDSSLFEGALKFQKEKRIKKSLKFWLLYLIEAFFHPYQILFRILLERSCY